MAIRKKYSRLITCNGKQFRWIISPADNYLKFIAEGENDNGRRIEVWVQSDIDRCWLEFPYVSDLNLKVIRPKDAASFIIHALNDGWKPEEKGSTILYQLIGDEIKRKEK